MESTSKPIDFERLSIELGGFGKFQILTYTLACLCAFYSGLFIVSPIFGSRVMAHRCVIPTCDISASGYEEAFLNFTTPWDEDTHNWDECHRFSMRNSPTGGQSSSGCSADNFNDEELVACHEWVYDKSEFSSTTHSEFDLTCDKAWLIPMEMASIMAGYVIGSIALGFLSDKFGRNFGIILSAIALSVSGIAAAFSSNYYVFLALRFIAGIGALGCFQIAFITAIEYIGEKWRTICGILLNVPFAFGEASFGLIAYFVRSWRPLLIASSVPVMVIFSYYWIMPESIRWLVTQNRGSEALTILQKAAKLNGKNISSDIEEQFLKEDTLVQESGSGKQRSQRSIFDLMKSPVIRRRSLVLFYCWMVCSLMYYGLSAYVGSFSGNLFINFTLVVLIEIPAYFFAALFSNIFGRKLILMISFLFGGTACITAGFLPPEYHQIMVTLSLMGKFGITAAFGAIFVYSGELYPTEYRAIGVGTCSMHGRIGGIIAPFIANLGRLYRPFPSLVFGSLSFLAGLMVLLLPETMGYSLPQTIEESEIIGQNHSTFACKCCSRSNKTRQDD